MQGPNKENRPSNVPYTQSLTPSRTHGGLENNVSGVSWSSRWSNLSQFQFQQTPNNKDHHYSGIYESDYHHQQPHSLMNLRRDSFILQHGNDESTFSHEGIIPMPHDAENYFRLHNSIGSYNDSRLSLGFDPRGISSHDTTYESLFHYPTTGFEQSHHEHRREPPPLPPKPRMSSSSSISGGYPTSRPSVGSEASLPIKSNHCINRKTTSNDNPKVAKTQKQQQRGYSVSFV